MVGLKPELSFDMLYEHILCKLPVKNLLRFRCVSKQWCSSLKSPEFIKHHLTNADFNLSPSLLVRFCNGEIYSVNPDSQEVSAKEVDHPFKNSVAEEAQVKVIGACDGLVAMYCKQYKSETTRIALWNPSTREHEILPECGKISYVYCSFWGLGYDVLNDDYKIVITESCRSNLDMKVKVYSLKMDSWRHFTKKFPCHLHQKGFRNFCSMNGAPCTGTLNWMVIDRMGNKSILRFDLGTEEFGEMAIPPDSSIRPKGGVSNVEVFAFGGSLHCIKSYFHKKSIEIWEMKENKGEESWVKIHCFAFDLETRLMMSDSRYCSSQGNKLWWYQWGKKKNRRFVKVSFPKIDGLPQEVVLCHVCHYRESLVSIKAHKGGESSAIRKVIQ